MQKIASRLGANIVFGFEQPALGQGNDTLAIVSDGGTEYEKGVPMKRRLRGH
jgi:hypothetical protein